MSLSVSSIALPALLLGLGKLAWGQCNPLLGTCAPVPGLTSSTYFVDFTQQSSTPSEWIQANYENVTYSKNGAEFALAQKGDAPYIWTDAYFLFGKVDVVMQAAPGTGVISSAVLMSDDLDEIDWEFSGNNFAQSGGRVQTNYFGKGITGNYDRGTLPSVSDPTKAFHTYSIDWSASKTVWSIDGTVIRTLPYSAATTGAYQYPQTPMRLHLGLWDAGDPAQAAGVVQWAGGYTDLTKLPYTAYVKSVRITPSSSCSSYVYGDKSGTYKSIQCKNDVSSVSSSSSLTKASTTSTSFPVASSVASPTVVVKSTSTTNLSTTRSATLSSNTSTSLSSASTTSKTASSTLSSSTRASSTVIPTSNTLTSRITSSTTTTRADSSTLTTSFHPQTQATRPNRPAATLWQPQRPQAHQEQQQQRQRPW